MSSPHPLEMRRSFGAAFFFVLIALCVAASSCGRVLGGAQPEALPAVSPVPSPAIPDWIVEISPRGEAQSLAQIRVIFKKPLIPLDAIEDPARQRQLTRFTVDPALPGRFEFLTPRMVGFQADRALPLATRIRVTLHAGLSDLSGDVLSKDVSWTFITAPIEITDLPADTANPTGLQPTIRFRSNVQLDPQSLAQHVSVVREQTNKSVSVTVAPEATPTPDAGDEDLPQETFDTSTQTWRYLIKFAQPLEKSSDYDVTVAAGVRPAIGNLPSAQAFDGSIRTYGPLQFADLTRNVNAEDRFEGGQPELVFNNPLVAQSVQKSLSISPLPASTNGLWQVDDGDQNVWINTAWLAPRTTYTITVGAGVSDSFGQTLGAPRHVTLQTGDLTPNFWMPDGVNIFPASENLQLHVAAVNLPERKYFAYYKVLHPVDIVTHDDPYSLSAASSFFPDPSDWPAQAVKAAPNRVVDITIPVRQKLGGMTGLLAYGAMADVAPRQMVLNSRDTAQYFGFLQLTNLGLFAQWFPSEGLIRVAHLSDGANVAGATVDVYATSDAPCATATTGALGLAVIGADAMRRCLRNAFSDYGGPRLVAVAKEGTDWAYAITQPWSGYGYGIDPEWDRGLAESRGTIFSDRSLYRPGERAYFTGAAYFVQNGALQQDADVSYDVSIVAPDGTARRFGRVRTDDYGMFSLHVALRADQPLGDYVIRAKGRSGAVIDGDFRVAEFRAPNFKVTLSLDKTIAYPGDTLRARSTAAYLFGAPISAGRASYYVTRSPTSFSPKGWDGYAFGRQWFWPEQQPEISSDVLQTKVALDSHGQFAQDVSVDKTVPYPLTYEVDAQVIDRSNLSVADSKTVTVLPSNELIGLYNDWIGAAGKPLAIKLIVTDTAGSLLPRRRVTVQLQRMVYGNTSEVVEGGETDVNAVHYETVGTADVRSSDQPETVSLSASSAGAYRIRANFTGASDDTTATDSSIWITGPGEVDWGNFETDVLHVKLDKTSYHVGDMATALIQSPYPAGQLFFAVVRHKLLLSKVQAIAGAAPVVRFRVTRDMLPNAAVEAVIVRRGKPLQSLAPGSIDSLARTGFAPFSVDLGDRYIKVSLAAQHASLAPAGRQTVDLMMRDAAGRPIGGEASVMVVNETVLQLTGYRPPDLVQTVYAPQSISTSFSDNRPDVRLAESPSPLQKGYGYGGGFMAAAASTRVRTNFQPLAYYNGAVHVDPDGHAHFSFNVPDDLTTWRVMAVAVSRGPSGDADFLFGNTDTTFVTTKPLVTDALLPLFARPGDSMQAGVSVTNLSGGGGTLDVFGQLSGPLAFGTAHSTSATVARSVNAPEGGAAYRFPMLASGTGTARVTFKSQIGGAADAFEIPLQIRASDSLYESVVETGVTADKAVVPLMVGSGIALDSGGLEIDTASTLLPELLAPSRLVLVEDALPFAEPQATRLAISADVLMLATRYGATPQGFDPRASAAAALTQLAKLQRADGGFAFCPCREEPSNIFVTPFVVRAIVAARTAGIPVSPSMLDAAGDYLKRELASPDDCGFIEPCMSRLRLDILEALAELGQRRTDYLSDIYAQRDAFDTIGKLRLARYLLLSSGWRAQGAVMAAQLREVIHMSGRYATINYPEEWGWLDSPTVARAEALQLYVAQNDDPEFIDRLVQSLLAARQGGRWATGYDTAEALSALIGYAALQPVPPDFEATWSIAGRRIGGAAFRGYAHTSAQSAVPMTSLPRGSSQVGLSKTGNGSLHYAIVYTYRLEGDRPGQLSGLRVTREVRAAGASALLAHMGLNAPDSPLSLQAGQVFDIGLQIITDHPVDHVLISDELPACMEAVDTSFKTSTPYYTTVADSWEIDYQTIHYDRITAYASRLEAGVYQLHYLVRTVTPGTFVWPSAEAHLEYAPEEFGRTSSSTLVVTSPPGS